MGSGTASTAGETVPIRGARGYIKRKANSFPMRQSMHLTRSSFLRRSLAIGFVVALAAPGCTDFSSTPEQLGHLIVTAKDESGAAAAGVQFSAFLADRATEWARVTTGSDGTAEFRKSDGGILPQTYVVRFNTQTQGFTLPTTETNDKPAVVVIGQTLTVNFVVKKTGVGGGPGGS